MQYDVAPRCRNAREERLTGERGDEDRAVENRRGRSHDWGPAGMNYYIDLHE